MTDIGFIKLEYIMIKKDFEVEDLDFGKNPDGLSAAVDKVVELAKL